MTGRDEESGRYTGEYPTETFLDAIRELGTMAGTGDIATEVGCAHDTAYKRLLALEDEGTLSSRKVGNTLLWSIESDEE